MNRIVFVKCPYCGHENNLFVKDDLRQRTIECCDSEDGGCDRNFAVYINVSIVAKGLKIEGEEVAEC